MRSVSLIIEALTGPEHVAAQVESDIVRSAQDEAVLEDGVWIGIETPEHANHGIRARILPHRGSTELQSIGCFIEINHGHCQVLLRSVARGIGGSDDNFIDLVPVAVLRGFVIGCHLEGQLPGLGHTE